jgi:hypothetical protein
VSGEGWSEEDFQRLIDGDPADFIEFAGVWMLRYDWWEAALGIPVEETQ